METRASGIGFLGLLAILFIGLKLGGVIAWSWWWVLSPLWVPWAFAAVLISGVLGSLTASLCVLVVIVALIAVLA